MCIPAPAITCVRTHHAQYQKKTNESFWYCAWCLRTHVIAGTGRHFPVLLPPLPFTPVKKFSKPSKYGRPSVDGQSRKFLSEKPRAGSESLGRGWTQFPLKFGLGRESLISLFLQKECVPFPENAFVYKLQAVGASKVRRSKVGGRCV